MVLQRHVLLILDPCWFAGFYVYINMFFCCCFCSCDGAKTFYLLPFMLSVILVLRKGFLIFSNAFQGLWRRTFRILLKYHFLHVPPNSKMPFITPVKVKHPPFPAFTLFLCLVISIAIIIRHWLPESEAVLFQVGCCNKYHQPSII